VNPQRLAYISVCRQQTTNLCQAHILAEVRHIRRYHCVAHSHHHPSLYRRIGVYAGHAYASQYRYYATPALSMQAVHTHACTRCRLCIHMPVHAAGCAYTRLYTLQAVHTHACTRCRLCIHTPVHAAGCAYTRLYMQKTAVRLCGLRSGGVASTRQQCS
jgi:hypothetical protein